MLGTLVRKTGFTKTRPLSQKNTEKLTEVSQNSRADYLTSIGLAFDPFAFRTAEQEARFYKPFKLTIGAEHKSDKSEEVFTPLAYFVSPEYNSKANSDLLTELHRVNPSFMFGGPGTGKTLLRLALEAVCRRQHDQTLVVTFSQLSNLRPPSGRHPEIQTPNKYWESLARDLVTDLLIQVIERYDFYNGLPDDSQTRELADLLHLSGRHLWRFVDRLLELKETPNGRYGLGEYWGVVNRYPVHYVGWSPRLAEWLVQLKNQEKVRRINQHGQAAFRRGVDTAAVWGFDHILVLVDDIRPLSWQIDRAKSLINPLLHSAARWHKEGVTFKFFLGNDLRSHVEAWAAQPENKALQPWLVQLTWSDSKLRELLRARFRAAGSLRVGFGDLVEPALGEKIDDMLISRAKGSPRHLLKMIDDLIKAYLDSPSEEETITLDDWQRSNETVKIYTPVPDFQSGNVPSPV